MPEIFQLTHTVTPKEIDWLGHANNLAYLAWMQDAAVAHSSAQGWNRERYHGEGVVWVARSHSIDYLRPAVVGDIIAVETWVSSLGKASSVRRYDIWRGQKDELLATAETNWALINLQTRRPTRIPSVIRESFAVVQRDDSRCAAG
jgi:acyl-CoA thioester hydrolase